MTRTHYKLCKLCQGEQLTTVYTSKLNGLRIMKCESCALRFVGRVFDSGEQEGLYQDETNYRAFVEAERSVPQAHARHTEWLAYIQEQLCAEDFAKAKQHKPKLLDIGCGAGDFLAVAREQGFEVRGLDVAAPAALIAAESHGIPVNIASIEDYPRDQFFDVTTAIGVLEHVIDPKSMLTHMHRLLAPGGLMFIYTPVWGMYDVLTSFLARISRGRFTRPIDRRINASHLQIFPKKTLIRLVQSLGLKIVTCDVVCEYNLPVELYLQSLGINQQRVRTIVTKTLNTLIDRKLFFRNNMRLIAQRA